MPTYAHTTYAHINAPYTDTHVTYTLSTYTYKHKNHLHILHPIILTGHIDYIHNHPHTHYKQTCTPRKQNSVHTLKNTQAQHPSIHYTRNTHTQIQDISTYPITNPIQTPILHIQTHTHIFTNKPFYKHTDTLHRKHIHVILSWHSMSYLLLYDFFHSVKNVYNVHCRYLKPNFKYTIVINIFSIVSLRISSIFYISTETFLL